MKRLFPLLFFALFGVFSGLPQTQTLTFTWIWPYPTNTPPPDSFVLFSSTNLTTPLTNWTAVAQVVNPIIATNVTPIWTNVISGVTNVSYMTNYARAVVTNLILAVAQCQSYYTLAPSNFWTVNGMSSFCNVIGLPPVPGNALGLAVH
jgi:hypothetical protein